MIQLVIMYDILLRIGCRSTIKVSELQRMYNYPENGTQDNHLVHINSKASTSEIYVRNTRIAQTDWQVIFCFFFKRMWWFSKILIKIMKNHKKVHVIVRVIHWRRPDMNQQLRC